MDRDQPLASLQKLWRQEVEAATTDRLLGEREDEYQRLTAAFVEPADRLVADEVSREVLDTILGRERWHVRGKGWVGHAIYGVNDGLGVLFAGHGG